MNVLFLTPWYPNRYDAMDGLFVRKHAQAAARFVDSVEVLCLKPDSYVSDVEVVETHINGVHEIVVHYRNPNNVVLKTYFFFSAFKKGYSRLRFRPDVVQVNVLTRCGVLAKMLWKLRGIPYVVMEHWTRYLPDRKCFSGSFHKILTQSVIKDARQVMTVSRDLTIAMQSRGLKSNVYCRVNNVVDDFFFEDVETEKRARKRILHISCFLDKQKNISGILRATRQLLCEREDFELVLVGVGVDYDRIKAYSESLSFPEGTIRFVGEQTPEEVSKWLSNSDFLVMFSNYETAGVIFSEAMASGKPIVSTKVGVLADQQNCGVGKLLDIGDEQGLKNAIGWMLDHYTDYDPDEMRKLGMEYSFDNVGKRLAEIYKSATS